MQSQLRGKWLIFAVLALPAAELLTFIAAILLIVPGFITGLFGGLLLIAPVRRHLTERLKRYFAPDGLAVQGIVDLPEEDWHVVPDQRIERRREP